jgi:hypothetical protein
MEFYDECTAEERAGAPFDETVVLRAATSRAPGRKRLRPDERRRGTVWKAFAEYWTRGRGPVPASRLRKTGKPTLPTSSSLLATTRMTRDGRFAIDRRFAARSCANEKSARLPARSVVPLLEPKSVGARDGCRARRSVILPYRMHFTDITCAGSLQPLLSSRIPPIFALHPLHDSTLMHGRMA